ncbi:MAG: hybrid sensor histidine kinase/response regulator [Verrucomicrobia bacterium]|nr:MAG: hybrid sensor histidine kinase/response regulator [Verrucomicrobiota bacterium]
MSKRSSFIPADLLYEAIVDSSDDAIVSKNLQSIVMSWNKGAERVFGYTAGEMIGQPIEKLFPPDRLDEETVIMARLQRGERVDHFETKRRRKDGELIDVSLTISPIRNAQGVIVGASKIARDITGPKIAQRRLAEANEELRRANQIKAEFLTTLSHELRTPLNAILGWIQILKDDPRADDVAQAVPILERNVRVQSQLIEDLLDMSRIEAGKIKLDIQHLDLAALVAAGIKNVRPAAEAKHIRLTSSFSNVFGNVIGDKDRLQQVFWNLLTNAIKFTPRRGRIHTMIKRVDSHVEISVSDTGQGIAPEFLPYVFDRFRQGDGTTARRYGGLGLGLSIVKRLTELHGGNVRVTSDGVGRGATFIVGLPLQSLHQELEDASEARRNEEVDRAAIKPDLKGIRVLVVDDEQDSVTIVQRILERRGAQVRGANSMNEALAEFAQFSPNVILSDIGMPGNDGYELISRLRGMPGGRFVPAVALTALARGEDRTRVLRAGFQMHVAKPVDFNELVAVVQNLAALRSEDR